MMLDFNYEQDYGDKGFGGLINKKALDFEESLLEFISSKETRISYFEINPSDIGEISNPMLEDFKESFDAFYS